MAQIIWTLKELVEIAIKRQKNEFDCNICFSGSRGTGKSWCAFKFFVYYNKTEPLIKFNPFIHQIYSRNAVMKLLEKQIYGVIFDDEAVRTAYKRNFAEADQKILIQMLNMYRDNFNIYAMAIPKFFSLDKDLRDLVKIHVHIIRRGFGIIHIARDDSLYSTDSWDTKYNQKLEETWSQVTKKNPNFTPPYYKITTFIGYLYIPKLTKKQERLYKTIKRLKRKMVYEKEMKIQREEDKPTEPTERDKKKLEIKRHSEYADKLLILLKDGELTKHSFESMVKLENLDRGKITTRINNSLKAENYPLTFFDSMKRNKSFIDKHMENKEDFHRKIYQKKPNFNLS